MLSWPCPRLKTDWSYRRLGLKTRTPVVGCSAAFFRMPPGAAQRT